jgi:uncharacterized protein YcbX
MSNTVEVVGLSYYPIKSCGATQAQEVTFSEFGIEHDREWILVGKNGQPLTQRIHPELALVQPSFEDGSLVAAAPGMGKLALSLERDPDAEILPVMLWKKPGTGVKQDAEASAWFSSYLRKDARLLRVEQPRSIRPECRIDEASEHTAFADGFPILLASTDSLGELNGHLSQAVTIDRFRPNIVVEGAPAYDEDYWREIQIGALRCFIVRACARCPVPNIDQGAGVLPRERPVTDALRETRRGIDPVGGERGEFFGQNVAHVFEPGAIVRLRDRVEVVGRATERNWLTVT